MVDCLCRQAAVLASGAVAEEDCAAREAVCVAWRRGGGVVGEDNSVGGAEGEVRCAEDVVGRGEGRHGPGACAGVEGEVCRVDVESFVGRGEEEGEGALGRDFVEGRPGLVED